LLSERNQLASFFSKFPPISAATNREGGEMKSSVSTLITAAILLAALALPLQMSAQQTHYQLIDLGTFGGPASAFNGGRMLNSLGFAVGASETSTPDQPTSNGWPCGPGTFVYHAFEYINGGVIDLGALPGTDQYCSNANSINAHGEIVGNSEIRKIDTVLGLHEIRAIRWKNARIENLGTFGGKHSAASDINDQGQIVGFALNQIPDPWSMFYGAFGNSHGTQTRAFLWQNGMMEDLGTLGGPDAIASFINQRGQVTGVAFTNSIPNATTGIPTQDPFFWDNGQIIDIGSLGGTLGQANALNSQGQVAGNSNLTGDSTQHAFLWDRGTLTDLGTLGGTFSLANWLNDEGEVVGGATTQATVCSTRLFGETARPPTWEPCLVIVLALPMPSTLKIKSSANPSRATAASFERFCGIGVPSST
jgi:probable HAF family extracellular repeat protein